MPSTAVTVTEPATTGSVIFKAEFDVAGTFLTENAGKKIVLVLTTKVVGVGDGEITNVANVTINEQEFEPDSFTTWGDVLIHKTDDAVPTAHDPQGAEFQVYESCDADGNGEGDPISVTLPDGTSATTFISDADGVVHIVGLYIGDQNDPQTERSYCVVETKAPAGYDLADPSFWEVDVQAGTTAAGEYDLTVVNPQKPPVALPLTGAAGTAAFTIGGIALMLMAAGAVLLANRRKQQHQGADE